MIWKRLRNGVRANGVSLPPGARKLKFNAQIPVITATISKFNSVSRDRRMLGVASRRTNYRRGFEILNLARRANRRRENLTRGM